MKKCRIILGMFRGSDGAANQNCFCRHLRPFAASTAPLHTPLNAKAL